MTTTTLDECVDSLYCPICNDIMMDGMFLSRCGHNFCYSCISRWLPTANTCPVCSCRHASCFEDIEPCLMTRFVIWTAQHRHGNLRQATMQSENETSTRRKLEETIKYLHNVHDISTQSSVIEESSFRTIVSYSGQN